MIDPPELMGIMQQSAIILMVKAPSYGQAKTRLVGPLAAEKVTSLYTAFIKDIAEKTLAIADCDTLVAFDPWEGESEVMGLVGEAAGYFRQEGEDLGTRMARAISYTFALGYARVVLIGSDIPTLPRSFLVRALSEVSETDLVLGPSNDGGYYLVGLNRPAPEIFDGIDWSTDRVLAQTLEKAKTLGLDVKLLPPWYDIDTPADLARLIMDIETFEEEKSEDLPRFTAADLRSFFGDGE